MTAVGAALDRGLYAAFSRHADRRRHDRDRRRYSGAALPVAFDTYISRLYGASWIGGAATGSLALLIVFALPSGTIADVGSALAGALPGPALGGVPHVPRYYGGLAVAVLVGAATKRAVLLAGGLRLKWRADARRGGIERTLPGAVRYLRALADGSEDRREMLRGVADQDAYGETAAEFRRVLDRAALTGSLDDALRSVARETPSREHLGPFLLKFREHANQGSDALTEYLRMESRMLSHEQTRARQRAGDFLELLAELFIVLLVLPALLVIVLTVMSVLAPGLSSPLPLPGAPTLRALLVYVSAGFVLLVGAATASLIGDLRPSHHTPSYRRPSGLATVHTAASNPASAAVVFLPVAIVVALGVYELGADPLNSALLGYGAYSGGH